MAYGIWQRLCWNSIKTNDNTDKTKTLLEIQHTNTMMFGKPTLYINVFRKPIIYIINVLENQSWCLLVLLYNIALMALLMLMMFRKPTLYIINAFQETNHDVLISPYIHHTDMSNSIHSTMKNKRKTEYTTILSLWQNEKFPDSRTWHPLTSEKSIFNL